MTERTLCIDVGGTSIKAALFDARTRAGDIRRVRTTYPFAPTDLIELTGALHEELAGADRVSIGFPGRIRSGSVVSAPLFVAPAGAGSPASPELVAAWHGFPLAHEVQHHLDRPTLVENDGDVHGAGAIRGHGLELTVTLGTGVGTGLHLDGVVCPHLELAHHPLCDGATYNEWLGDAARLHVGDETWSRRVLDAVGVLDRLLDPDRIWLGGGNAARLTVDLPVDVEIVSPEAGLLGGVHLWEHPGSLTSR